MTTKKLSTREEIAIESLEFLQGFVEGKQASSMPIFTDELLEIWCHLETAMAMIEQEDWE
jgi:hypothetical protein